MSQQLTKFFASRWGIIFAGAIIGILVSLLQKFGNPPNMGIAFACFKRDIAGALGLHQVGACQYVRPEIIGMILGALIAAFAFNEFRPRAGSAPIVRFILGVFAMIGALAFHGCSWRALIRLAGGDLNAITGLAGFTVGIVIAVQLFKSGFNPGRSYKTQNTAGWILPAIMIGLLLILFFQVEFGSGPLRFSKNGSGAMHAPLFISLGAALIIGFLAQRTRFCTMSAIRDVILMKNPHLIIGLVAMLVAAFITNLIFWQVKIGFSAQPIAHSNHLWNFLATVLTGLTFAMAGGCPGRQLILAGEGDCDSVMFIIGMFSGAAFAHTHGLAGKPDKIVEGVVQVGGLSTLGMIAVILGLMVCLIIGFTMREKYPNRKYCTSQKINARGLSCSQPVLVTNKAIEKIING